MVLLGLVLTFISARGASQAKGPEVLVAADALATPESFRPEPGKPVYYIFSQTQLSLGESVAGIKMPDAALVESLITAELTKQGFVRTQVGGPMPSVFIVAMWGDSNFTYPPDPDDDNPDLTPEEKDRRRRLRYLASARSRDKPLVEAIVGVRKMESEFSSSGMKVAAAANEDRLYISLMAFDAQRYAKKEKRLLWRTSMSVGWKNDLAVALPAMLASGGPFFGSDVKTPAFMDDRARQNFEVRIGEAREVVEERKPEVEAERPK